MDLLVLPPEFDNICDIQVGISQGLMFSGAYGGSERRTYGVLGAETNTAARLMEKAEPGQVLVTSRISQAAAGTHRFKELVPVKVKGISEPVSVCRLLDRRQRPQKRAVAHATTEMVGRLEERRILAERLQLLREGNSCGVIIIEGEAGIGKSRLLEDLMQNAEAGNVPYFLGAGDAIEKNAAYHAFRAIFWDYFDLGTVVDGDLSGAGYLSQNQMAHIRQILESAVPDQTHLVPLLDAVLPIDLPDNDLTTQMSGEARVT